VFIKCIEENSQEALADIVETTCGGVFEQKENKIKGSVQKVQHLLHPKRR
jgi:1-deoxy-D-xylulose 5-phosphate reductoisomerase